MGCDAPIARWPSAIAGVASLVGVYTLIAAVAFSSDTLLYRALETLILSTLFSTYSIASLAKRVMCMQGFEDIAQALLVALVASAVSLSTLHAPLLAAIAASARRRVETVETEASVALAPRYRMVGRLSLILWPLLAPLIAYQSAAYLEAASSLSTLTALPVMRVEDNGI